MFNPTTTFRDAKKVGAGWMAKCPAHDDRKASLSIGIGDGGKILLKCFAGCDLDDILAAAHLELVLRDRIVCQPTTLDGAAAYELTMPIVFDRLLTTIVPDMTSRNGVPNATGPAVL